jgi:excisionase family DNA binding protein
VCCLTQGEFFLLVEWIFMNENQMATRLNITQAASRLGVSVMTLRRKVYSGEITYYRPSANGRIMFTEEQLREFEQRHTVEAKS